jgi:hypothetical protein
MLILIILVGIVGNWKLVRHYISGSVEMTVLRALIQYTKRKEKTSHAIQFIHSSLFDPHFPISLKIGSQV